MMAFRPLKPGVWLMRRLMLPTKLFLMSLVLVVPLVVVSVALVTRLGDDIEFTRSELSGTRITTALAEVTTLVQQHRGQTNMLLSGAPAARAGPGSGPAGTAPASAQMLPADLP